MSKETANRLAKLCTAQGWTRKQSADHLKVHVRTVYRYEMGESNIPDATKAELCDLFGVSLDHLMGRDLPRGPILKGGGADGP